MNNYAFGLITIVPILIYILLGFTLRKSIFSTKERIAGVNKLCANVLLPINLFNSSMRADYTDSSAAHTTSFCIVATLIAIILLVLIVPRFIKTPADSKSVIQGGFRGNLMVITVALMANMYGSEGSALAGIVIAPVVALYNILAVFILTDYRANGPMTVKSVLKVIVKALTCPLLIGAVFGMIFSFAKIVLPAFLDSCVKNLAVCGSCISLIILGAQFDIKKAIKDIRLSAAAVIFKVIILPLVGVIAGVLLGFKQIEIACIYAVLGVPASTNSAVIAESLGCNGRLSGDIVILSNLVFLVVSIIAITAMRLAGLI